MNQDKYREEAERQIRQECGETDNFLWQDAMRTDPHTQWAIKERTARLKAEADVRELRNDFGAIGKELADEIGKNTALRAENEKLIKVCDAWINAAERWETAYRQLEGRAAPTKGEKG